MGICGMALTLGSVEIFRWKKYEVTTLLPEGYTPVEYIQSTGTQYIDTGFVPTANTKLECDFAYTTLTRQYFGSLISNAYFAFGMNGSHELYYGNTYKGGKTATTDRTTIVIDGANKVASIGSDTYSFSGTPFTASTYSLLLFALRRNASSITNYCYMRLYPCRISDNGDAARDYMPCKNASGKGGVFDLVNNSFGGNAGTGDFIVGPEIENIAVGDFIEEVKSLNSNAYPDGGVKDGYYYERVV